MDETPATIAAPQPETTVDAAPADSVLTPLHPDHVKVLRIQAGLTALPFIVAASIVEATGALLPGIVIGPILLIAILVILRVPLRRYQAKGYAMSRDRLRVVRGVLFSSDTVVPFGRVQHIDVDQGPLERMFDLTTLTVHTAGNHNSSVHLPGLLNETAVAMREEIRAHIKRESL